MSDEIKIHLDVPPDFHPKALRGESQAAEYARGGLELIYHAAGRVQEAMRTVDDKKELHKVASGVIHNAEKHATKRLQTLEERAAQAKKELDAELSVGGHHAQAPEIRAHLKGLNATERQAFVRHAIDGVNRPVVGAFYGAPGFLSGFTDEQAVVLRDYAEKTLAPKTRAEIDDAHAAHTKLTRALEWYRKNMGEALAKMYNAKDRAALEKLKGVA